MGYTLCEPRGFKIASLNVVSLMLYIDEIRLIVLKLGLISVLKKELVNVVG